MKVCIVTVYNSENCGSYLQAYALSECIKRQKHEVCFLERGTSGTSHSFMRHIKSSLKCAVSGNFVKLKNIWKAYKNTNKAVKKHEFVKLNSRYFQEQEVIIIGSDTLWNFSERYFQRNKLKYSGLLFKGKKVVTYAVSIANTPSELIVQDNELCDGLRGMTCVSVRDKRTADVYYRVSGKNAQLVLDPTLLLSIEEYQKVKGICQYNHFILIYSLLDILNSEKQQIIDFSKKNNLKIISFGSYLNWADINIAQDPFDFLAFIDNAEYVVTNTYHGTVFSTIFKKNFVCLNRSQSKVFDFLNSINATDRVVAPQISMEEKFGTEIDYDAITKILDVRREASLKFLTNSIAGGSR